MRKETIKTYDGKRERRRGFESVLLIQNLEMYVAAGCRQFRQYQAR
jgi:hypothetical protein